MFPVEYFCIFSDQQTRDTAMIFNFRSHLASYFAFHLDICIRFPKEIIQNSLGYVGWYVLRRLRGIGVSDKEAIQVIAVQVTATQDNRIFTRNSS